MLEHQIISDMNSTVNVIRYQGISADSEVLGVGGSPSVSAEYPQVLGLKM